MADQDELRLRIVPELDPDALKEVQRELDDIPSKTPLGKPKRNDSETSASNAIKKEIQTRIEVRELEIRKIQQAAAQEIKFLQQRAAQGKITTTQMASDIQLVENAQVQANDRAIASFNALQSEILKTTGLTEAHSAALQKKLLLATDRVDNNFVSMSRSMGTLTSNTSALTSNTKSANIAFANFGRIVQDAPFGLLGISNNIDPLLNSFSQLKTETGGTGLALRALGKQLIGPAGLIFLLGSALPTALLFAQKYMRDMKKETEDTNDALDDTIEQFARLAAKAAAGQGVRQIEVELGLARDELGRLTKEYENIAAYRRGKYIDAEKEAILTSIDGERKIAQAVIDRLEAQRTEAKVEQSIQNLRKRGAVAESLRIDEAIDKRNKDREGREKDAEAEAQRVARIANDRTRAEQALSKIFDDELTQRIKAEQASVRELLANDQLRGEERIRLLEYYNGIAERLRDEHNARVLNEQTESNDRLLKEQQRAADEASRAREQEQRKALQDARERQSIEAMVAQDMIALMYARGQTIKAIEKELEEEIKRIRAEYDEAEKTGLVSAAELVAGENAAIAEAELTAEREKMDARVQMGNMAAKAVIDGLSAAFGQSKGIKAAEVAIQSITAAYEAFSSMQAKFAGPIGAALGTAAAAGILAKGRQSIKEIYATKPGSRGASSSGASSSLSASSGPKFVNDLGAAGMVAGTIGPFGASMTPNISITANLDRQGLALAVRDGESDIATRQIPFAS
jgi:hypothetical protein